MIQRIMFGSLHMQFDLVAVNYSVHRRAANQETHARFWLQ
jgi:hypothetical protein